MSKRISFINGNFVDHDKAFVHIDDRAFQFGDGVYEVVLFFRNKLIDFDPHWVRLERSLKEINIAEFDLTKEEVEKLILQLFAKNDLQSGSVYFQVTRGVLPRTQGLVQGIKPTFVMTVSPLKIPVDKHLDAIISAPELVLDSEMNSYKAISHEDLRWSRCDIKSLNLLAPNMIRQKAYDFGAIEAILLRDGKVAEGCFCNIFIVDANNVLIAPLADNFILKGITRDRVIELAKESGIKVVEKHFSKNDLLNAKEVFLTSSTLLIRPILQIDDKVIAQGIGKITRMLATKMQDFCK